MRQEYVEYEQIRDQLIAEGHYKTYKVEGILDLGTQVFGETADRQIYMRQNDYFDLTGYGENDIAGMKYKVNLDDSRKSASETKRICTAPGDRNVQKAPVKNRYVRGSYDDGCCECIWFYYRRWIIIWCLLLS